MSVSIAPQADPADYTDEQLRTLSQHATEAAMLVLMPYFQGEGRKGLGRGDYEMIRTAFNLMVARKAGRPIIA